MIGYTGLKLVDLDETKSVVKVRLKRRTKNHLNSMYFGALAVGADVSGGIHAFYFANKYNKKVSFAFKAMECEFIKRAESDCTFICNDGVLVEKSILRSIETGERINEKTFVNVYDSQNELVAKFKLTISVKCK
ncbi:MAG: DUF4442 domain-containing protein [Flavobacteriales bacterium]|nr:DUF4442 domain-containing protein [Flavobacteriales bacterium]